MDQTDLFLESLFNRFIQGCQLEDRLPQLPISTHGKTLILAIGKAAVQLAEACETQLLKRFDGEFPAQGILLCRQGEHNNCQHFRTFFAAHPLPDQGSLVAAQSIINATQRLQKDDQLICLLSGGGSSLFSYPASGIAPEEKRHICQALLLSGANIEDINCVRKHISYVKGGQLAKLAYPATVNTYAISDVVGDKADVIASGPTVADPSHQAQALDILKRFNIELPDSVAKYLSNAHNETPKPGDPCFADNHFDILLSPAQAFAEFTQIFQLEHSHIELHYLGSELEDDAQDLAREHAQVALNIAACRPQKPQLILSGGEATVDVQGNGRGGPNTEYALALALALDGQSGIYGLAADTDGIDGCGDNAGALIGPQTLAQNKTEAQQYLQNNDSYGFFKRFGGLLLCGPTYTNVNDFRVILVLPEKH
ncbi:glycerate kinase type-2 family protein [Pseudoteredinibacter isoporae]|uniref:glycerate kinase type-2 family protein n=1 Tax=Pseudoteredinibacter isoporae TaxID=570281 RepID=UPI003340CF13